MTRFSNPPGDPRQNLERALQKPRDPRAGLQKPVDHAHHSQIQQGKFTFSNPMTHRQWMQATEAGIRHPRSL